jgi:hypothetical protein
MSGVFSEISTAFPGYTRRAVPLTDAALCEIENMPIVPNPTTQMIIDLFGDDLSDIHSWSNYCTVSSRSPNRGYAPGPFFGRPFSLAMCFYEPIPFSISRFAQQTWVTVGARVGAAKI